MTTDPKQPVPIWFFIGLLLLVYGILCLGAGIEQLSNPPPTTLANLHATLWGGIVLTLLGSFYVLLFRPSRSSR